MRNKVAGLALRTSLVYTILASLWILFSDRLLADFVSDPHTIARISIAKGWGFVVITAWLFYLAMRRQLKLQEREIAGRKGAESSLQTTNRALRMISNCSQILIHATDEIELLENICRLVVKEGGFAMAWVGFAAEDETKSIRPMAQAGPETGYLETLRLTWADEPRGRGPTGIAVRTGQVSVFRDLDADHAFVPWRDEAQRRGYKSAIGLPLTAGNKTFGSLTIYSSRTDAFDAVESALLLELAGDLAFGITALRSRLEHERIEQALRRSEERLRLAQTAAKTGIFDVDLVRDYATWTEEEEAIFGFAPGTFDHASGTFWQLLHPEDRERIRQIADKAIADHAEFNAEYRFHRHNDQALRWVMVRGKAVYDNQGQPVRMLGVNIDITEHKNAELALRMSEALYHSLVEQMPAGVFCKDKAGHYILANSRFCRLRWMKAEDLLGKTSAELILHESVKQNARHEELIQLLNQGTDHHELIMRTGRKIELEEMYLDATGKPQHLRILKSPIFGPDGEIIGSQGILLDITQLKHTEEAYMRLATAVEQAVEDILITDATGKILYVNPAFEKTSGYTRLEAIGQNPRLLKSGKHDDAFYQRMWEVLKLGGVWSGHFINRKKDGTLFEEETTISPIRDAAGKIINYVSVRRDVTREVTLEAQLRQAQKMEAIGQLAGGVAHDFNNLLTAIHGNAAQLLDAQLEPGEALECSQQILEAAERAATLTRQLLMFSRKQIMQPANLDLNEVVAQTAKMLQRILGEDVSLLAEYSSQLPLIKADVGMIEQILLNLAVNSRDAMPEGGKLVIATGAGMLDEKQVAQNAGAVPGQYVHLAITDTGCGIPPEHLPRIFEPFFTTKEVGKGTGLGLATVYGIVQQHHGWITVTSAVNQGTTFRIYFPAVIGEKARKTSETEILKLPRGTEAILVVEDEAIVRLIVGNMLQRFGYTVWQAESGDEALKLWKQHKNQIQLLLTDMVMPDGMTGHKLARQLQADKPQLKVIFTSGYNADLGSRHSTLVEGVNFLQKPYAPQKLAEILRKSLDQK